MLEKIKEVTSKPPYLYSFLGISTGYVLLNFFINKLFITLPSLTGSLIFIIPFVFFNILVPLLVGINANLVYIKFKELHQISKESGLTLAGAFAGVLGGACPGCFVGLFPAAAGLFGVTVSLGSLPWHGFEIQIISSSLLIISLFFLTRDDKCKIKRRLK